MSLSNHPGTMLFVPINAESETALDERNAKTLEQQQAEAEKFLEMKSQHAQVVESVKENQLLEAERMLLQMFDTDLFSIRSYDGKQLQRAAMKLFLSLPSSNRHLEVCLKALEIFPDENYFLIQFAKILFNCSKFDEAADAYELLYRTEPLNPDYLTCYVDSLKKAGNLVKLDDLRDKLVKADLMIVEKSIFEWKSCLSEISLRNEMMIDSESDLVPELSLPMKEVNWTNYANILYSMASGNYASVFKKIIFEPSRHAILTGPCVIEISHNGASTQTQQTTQSLLLSSVHEYLTSSMEDVNTPSDTQSKRRSTTRRRDARPTFTTKSEISPSEFIKNMSQLLFLTENEVADTLCSTEGTAIALIDKNSVSNVKADDRSVLGLFTTESLINLIEVDNRAKSSVSVRIFNLLRYFFIDSLGQPFPSALGQQMYSLSRLFHDYILSFDNLEEFIGHEFVKYCLGVAELAIELEPTRTQCHELSLAHIYEASLNEQLRLQLLVALYSPPNRLESIASLSLTSPINTRFFKCLPHLVTQQSLDSLKSSFAQLSSLEEAEGLLSSASASEILSNLGAPDESAIFAVSGLNRLRLGKVLMKTLPSVSNEFIETITMELLDSASALDLNRFADYFSCLLEHSIGRSFFATFTSLFWNIFSRKQSIPAATVSLLQNCFSRLMASIVAGSECHLDVYLFILNWIAQERCFGSAQACLPLEIFRKLCKKSEFPAKLVSYSISYSIWKFQSIFTGQPDAESGWEEWDRHPIGTKECPTLPVTFVDFSALCNLIWEIVETLDAEEVESKLIISDPNTILCIDWLKEACKNLSKDAQFERDFNHIFELNRNQIKNYLCSPLELHVKGSVARPKHFEWKASALHSLRALLNFRSDLVHAELQGRKKSLEILKTIRSDLKSSLSIQGDDAEVWKLLGTCYYDALVHFLSSDAENITAQQGKLKRSLKKAILCFQESLRLDRQDLEAWAKLSDLCDWSLHYPSQLTDNAEVKNHLCVIGCSAVQFLLPKIAARDRWQQLLRLELFLRHSQLNPSPRKLLSLIKQAVISACQSYCENVYESTALFNSLAKYYSRISKTQTAQEIGESLSLIRQYLPPIVTPPSVAFTDPLQLLQAHLDALCNLDRKKIFHSHYMTASWTAWKQQKDPQSALSFLANVFPFLKPGKKVATSLILIYQSDHDRPARFLACTRRYILQLINFITESAFTERLELLATLMKKLHYVRKTILAFPELLLAATSAYFTAAEVELNSNAQSEKRQEIIAICWELIDSLEEVGCRVPVALREAVFKFDVDEEEDDDEEEEEEDQQEEENQVQV